MKMRKKCKKIQWNLFFSCFTLQATNCLKATWNFRTLHCRLEINIDYFATKMCNTNEHKTTVNGAPHSKSKHNALTALQHAPQLSHFMPATLAFTHTYKYIPVYICI